MSTLSTNPDTKIWIDDASGNIGIVDLNTGAATTIGNSGAALTDIAFSPTGQLFGESFSEFYKIDQKSGAATPVGALRSNTPRDTRGWSNSSRHQFGSKHTDILGEKLVYVYCKVFIVPAVTGTAALGFNGNRKPLPVVSKVVNTIDLIKAGSNKP